MVDVINRYFLELLYWLRIANKNRSIFENFAKTEDLILELETYI